MATININCRTEGSGIRLVTDDPTYTPDMLGVLSSTPSALNAITMKFYSAWWYFLHQVLGISTDEFMRSDFSPVRFILKSISGAEYPLCRTSIDRLSGVTKATSQEWVFSGEFKIELDGLALAGEANDFAFARPAIWQFLIALNKGFVQVGGGRSIGRGFVRIENLDEMEYSIVGATPINPSKGHKCKKGHFAPWSTASFGGKCRCGAKIKPIWAKIPPGYYWLGGE